MMLSRTRPVSPNGLLPGLLRRALLLALAVGLGAGTGCVDSASESDGGPRPQAPAFELPTLAGSEIALESQRGKIVIVDFWATWCAPCEVQMPVLDALWQEEGGTDFEVIGVSVDTIPPPEIESWVAERGIRYPVALGDQELAMRYGVIGFPSLFIIDPSGRIHTHHTGVLSRPELDEILQEIRLESGPGR
jgi:peroxiredoxin